MRLLFLLTSFIWLLFTAGCSTTSEPDNLSVRPWNVPKGWESGLPPGMTEGR